MQAHEAKPELLLAGEQVSQILAIVASAAGAAAVLHQRTAIVAKASLAHLHRAIGSERGSVPAEPGGDDAVEEVDAASHTFHEVVGKANAHEIARQATWEHRVARLEHRVERGLGLSHRDTADGDPVPLPCPEDSRHRRATECVVRPPLHDGKERLTRRRVVRGEPDKLRAAALEPAERTLHRGAGGRPVHVTGDEFIELHDDVCPEVALDADRQLGGVLVQRPFDGAAKLHALFAHHPLTREREDLEATRIGEHRPAPARELLHPSRIAHHGIARAQVQVQRVGEHHLGAGRAHLVHAEAAHRRLRGHRHEGRCMDLAVRRGEGADPRGAARLGDAEGKVLHHDRDIRGRARSARHAHVRRRA